MLPIMLAGLSALIWGLSDFCGGLAVRNDDHRPMRALTVSVTSHLYGLPIVLLFLVLVPSKITLSGLVCGCLAGVLGITAMTLLYHCLGTGRMSIGAPIAAVTAAAVPVAGGYVLGERPAIGPLSGVALAILAIALLAIPDRPAATAAVPIPCGGSDSAPSSVTTRSRSNLAVAVAAGLACGFFYLILGSAGPGAGMWPLAFEAVVSVAIGLCALSFAGRRALMPLAIAAGRRRALMPLATAAGVFDMTATGIYVAAAMHADIALVAPIAALDPASTILLAMIISKERLRLVQFAGLGFAAVALVLTAS